MIDRTGLKSYLRHVSGVVHVGAHTGQERELYAQYDLDVLWIEALDEVFDVLKRNIVGYPRQRAVKALVTDRHGGSYEFHVASNAGGSSSIFELGLHKDIWPDVSFTKTVAIESRTLATLFEEHGIDPARYDALVMDTQGSELLVLKGAGPLLENFRFIQTEVADFEAYRGCCQLAELESFLAQHGYKEYARRVIARHPSGGGYFDIVFVRSSPGS